MTAQEAIQKLNDLEMKEFAYGHALGLLSYDGETIAPRDARIPRGRSMGVLAGELHRLSTGPEAMQIIDALREHKDELPGTERRRLALWEKSLRELTRIPVEEYTAFTELQNDASAAWKDAKEKSDYAIFEPYLQKLIDTQKHFASLVEPDMDPYDYMLDQFEEGLTKERCDAFFKELREKLTPMVERVKAAKQPDMACANVKFPIPAQRELANRLMEVEGLPRERCSIGETEHPFTTGFSKYDNRITTHYLEDNWLSAMYSTVHEGGHALYDMHSADEYAFTTLEGGVSMGVHESQSRFFENIIGRSREFIAFLYPDFVRYCPALAYYTPDDIYRAANKAEPSLIRTEADELTYCLHVMVRYELEKRFICGDVPVKELPGMWNALYKEYLGLDVPNDREGILQDSHWSGGSFGYFPSYALGSAYGAQLLAKMRETVDVKECVARGDLSPVSGWLEEKIWRHGCLVPPGKLMEDAFGGPFDPSYYTDYLSRKMADVYGF